MSTVIENKFKNKLGSLEDKLKRLLNINTVQKLYTFKIDLKTRQNVFLNLRMLR